MLHIYSLAASLYVLWRFVLPLKLGAYPKLVAAVLLLLFANHHFFSSLLVGNVFSPETPRPLAAILGIGFFTFVLLLLWSLVSDLVRMIAFLFRRRINAMHSPAMAASALLVMMVIAALDVWNATRVPEVKFVELKIKGLPPAFEGFTFVQISDTHISKLFPRDWVAKVVEKTNQLNPRLVVITGDFIDGTPEERQADIAPLAKLHAKYGVYGILGNHEYYFDAHAWTATLQQLGVQLLLNRNVRINAGDDTLVLAGVTDPTAIRYGLVPPDVRTALAGVQADEPVILLNHRPDDTQLSAQLGVDVQLSGHTHGGMVPILTQITRYSNHGFVSGLYQVDGMHLYVSNGTALWSGFPVRLGVPPEITQFTLVADR
jgi:predicted MPP superfamily phosphohydrolase